MNTRSTVQLWGIYHLDQDCAKSLWDPLRTVVEASSPLAAQEQAARLGFSDARVRPVTLREARKAQWLPKRLQSPRPSPGVSQGIGI